MEEIINFWIFMKELHKMFTKLLIQIVKCFDGGLKKKKHIYLLI